MKSTGEVIGLDTDYAIAFAKSQLANVKVPKEGTVSSRSRWRQAGNRQAARHLADIGFKVIATGGTQRYLAGEGIDCKINKVLEGRPHIVDAIKNGEVHLVINTTDGVKAVSDSRDIAAPPSWPRCLTTTSAPTPPSKASSPIARQPDGKGTARIFRGVSGAKEQFITFV